MRGRMSTHNVQVPIDHRHICMSSSLANKQGASDAQRTSWQTHQMSKPREVEHTDHRPCPVAVRSVCRAGTARLTSYLQVSCAYFHGQYVNHVTHSVA